jgi:hypothetical protein
MRLGAAFVETLGHRAREFPDANRLRPTHPASVVADRPRTLTGGEGRKSFASLFRMWGVTTRVLLAGTVAGAAAGMMMAAVEMIYGWASSAHTAWDAPMGIWVYIGGLNYFGHPANHIWPIVLGIGGHMMNAIVVGLVFVALLRVLRNPPGALLLGAAYGRALGSPALRLPANQNARGQALHDRHDQPAVGLVGRPHRSRNDPRPRLPAVRPLAARRTRASSPAGRARAAPPQSA